MSITEIGLKESELGFEHPATFCKSCFLLYIIEIIIVSLQKGGDGEGSNEIISIYHSLVTLYLI